MTPEEIDDIITESRAHRLESIGSKLLSGLDRSEESLLKFSWELEEELNDSLYTALDLMGWSEVLLWADFRELEQDLACLLTWFELREEYECCALVQQAQTWLSAKLTFIAQEIKNGVDPTSLIGI